MQIFRLPIKKFLDFVFIELIIFPGTPQQ